MSSAAGFDADRLERSVEHSIEYLGYLEESRPGPQLDNVRLHLEKALLYIRGELPAPVEVAASE
jgi:hypothetical protein